MPTEDYACKYCGSSAHPNPYSKTERWLSCNVIEDISEGGDIGETARNREVVLRVLDAYTKRVHTIVDTAERFESLVGKYVDAVDKWMAKTEDLDSASKLVLETFKSFYEPKYEAGRAELETQVPSTYDEAVHQGLIEALGTNPSRKDWEGRNLLGNAAYVIGVLRFLLQDAKEDLADEKARNKTESWTEADYNLAYRAVHLKMKDYDAKYHPEGIGFCMELASAALDAVKKVVVRAPAPAPVPAPAPASTATAPAEELPKNPCLLCHGSGFRPIDQYSASTCRRCNGDGVEPSVVHKGKENP